MEKANVENERELVSTKRAKTAVFAPSRKSSVRRASRFQFLRNGRAGDLLHGLEFLARADDFIHEPVILRLLRAHVVVAVRVALHLLVAFAGLLRQNVDEPLLELEHELDRALD